MTSFEKQIRKAPLRSLPPQWREEILTTAMRRRPSWGTAFPGKFRNPKSKIRNFFWPHPAAWGVLAACWLLAAALCFSGPRGKELYAVTPPGVKKVNVNPEQYAAYLKARDDLTGESTPAAPFLFNRKKL